jgi:hypothetical protein
LLGELILQLFLLLLQALQVVVVHPLQVHALLEEVTPFPSHAALDDLLQLNHLLLLESQKAFYLLYLVEEGNVLAFLLHLLTLQLACLISKSVELLFPELKIRLEFAERGLIVPFFLHSLAFLLEPIHLEFVLLQFILVLIQLPPIPLRQ